MTLSIDDVKKVSHLARLMFNEQDLPVHAKNLSNILDLIDQMNNCNTENVAPMAHPLELNQPLRSDTVTEQNARDYIQKIAPHVEAGLYLVPQVIE